MNTELSNKNGGDQDLLLEREIDEVLKKHFAIEDFRDRLENIHKKEFGNPKIINLFQGKNTWYWSAASIVGLLGGSYLYFNQRPGFDSLYRHYYQAYQPAVTFRSAESEAEVSKIIEFYNSGQYTKTIALIENIEKMSNLSPNMVLVKGCSLMELKQYKAALSEFEKFDSKTYTLYTESAYWYKALCFIKLEDTEAALVQLEFLIENGVSYQEKAEKLKEKIVVK